MSAAAAAAPAPASKGTYAVDAQHTPHNVLVRVNDQKLAQGVATMHIYMPGADKGFPQDGSRLKFHFAVSRELRDNADVVNMFFESMLPSALRLIYEPAKPFPVIEAEGEHIFQLWRRGFDLATPFAPRSALLGDTLPLIEANSVRKLNWHAGLRDEQEAAYRSTATEILRATGKDPEHHDVCLINLHEAMAETVRSTKTPHDLTFLAGRTAALVMRYSEQQRLGVAAPARAAAPGPAPAPVGTVASMAANGKK